MHSVRRLVTFIMISSDRKWHSICKSKVLLVTFCLWFVVEVAKVATTAPFIHNCDVESRVKAKRECYLVLPRVGIFGPL